MAYCFMHNRETLGPCPDCVACYEKEVAEGHIPPAFISAGVDFSFSDWSQIRRTEYNLAMQHVNPKYGRTEKARQRLEAELAEQIAQDKEIIAQIAKGLAAAHLQDEKIASAQRRKELNNIVERCRTY